MSFVAWRDTVMREISQQRAQHNAPGATLEAEISFQPLEYQFSGENSRLGTVTSWKPDRGFFHQVMSRYKFPVDPIVIEQTSFSQVPVKYQQQLRHGQPRLREIGQEIREKIVKIPIYRDENSSQEYGLKFTLSVELPERFYDAVPKKPQGNFRITRWSLLNHDLGHQLDLTEYSPSRGPKFYRVELELNISQLGDARDLERAIGWANFLLTGSRIFYGIGVWQPIISQVVSDLNISKQNYLSNARTLSLKDLTSGGLISGESPYYVSHKADGQRVLYGQVTIQNRIYRFLVRPPFGLGLLEVVPTGEISGHMVLFEGELVQSRLLLYDTLLYQGQNLAVGANYATRLAKLDQFLEISNIAIPGFSIERKKAWEISPGNFFSAMREVFSVSNAPDFPQDGIILTPNRTYGKISPDPREPIKSSSIILKWKPLERLTIDFLINRQGFPGDRDGTTFRGTEIYPHNPEKVPDQYIGLIVEMGLDSDKRLKIHRIRGDKLTPNSAKVIESNWYLMNNPVRQETLCGQGSALMRFFHNTIKKTLLDLAPERSTLLDIGSGRGGDLAKWNKFGQVLAVEPNLDNVEEFSKRQRGGRSLVIIRPETEDLTGLAGIPLVLLVAPAEDTERIREVARAMLGPNRKFDYISGMLSLSLFPIREFVRLAEMANRAIYFTIDRQSVEISRERNSLPRGDDIKIEVLQDDPLEILVDIADSLLVKRQREFPPDTIALDKMLIEAGFVLRRKTRADYAKFLNPEETLMSQLYVYGEFER